MIFRRMTRQHGRGAAFALTGALALAIVAGMASSERMVQSAFDAALSGQSTQAQRSLAAAPLPQSEEFWLRHGGGQVDVKPVAWKSTPINPGDVLTITPAGSKEARVFEVVAAAPLPGHATRTDGVEQAPLLAISCRDVAGPDAGLLRIIVDERTLAGMTTRKAADRAL